MDPMFSKIPKPNKPQMSKRVIQAPDIRPVKLFKETQPLNWWPILIAAFGVLLLVLTLLQPTISYGVTFIFGMVSVFKHLSARTFFILALIALLIVALSLFLPGSARDISTDLAPHIYLLLVFGVASLLRE